MPGLDIDALLDDLADRVAARLADRLPTTSSTPKRLLTKAEAARYIGRSPVAIDHMVSKGLLPTVQTDRRVFLDTQDLDEWIRKAKVR